MRIESIKAKEILTSKGSLTVEVCLETAKGQFVASVPSGVSTGDYEAVEIPASEAIKKTVEIEPMLKKRDFFSQKDFDCFLLKQDGTKNKSRLGANTTLSLSIAFCRALAAQEDLPLWKYIHKICNLQSFWLRQISSCSAGSSAARHSETIFKMPRPCVLLFEGGKHGNGGLTFQEILLVPQGGSFQEMFDKAKIVFETLKSQLNYPFGLEGGLVAPLKEEEILDLITQRTSEQIGIDVAASSFFVQGKYDFQGKKIFAENFLAFYQVLRKNYNILFFEDPFSQDDINGWKKAKEIFSVGDDLLATNVKRMKKAKKFCWGAIIKPNQIGTVWETLQAVRLAKKFGWKIIVSHRAGETEDSFIADLAVGVGADFIKAGGLSQQERLAKYNRLLEIEKALEKMI